MLASEKISEIARSVATANLTSQVVRNVFSEPATDSQGRDALRITIVIPDGAAQNLAGDAVLDTLVQIQAELTASGEERFTIVEYATQEELEDVGDSES